ncbi:MAG: YHS domain-containing protein [Fimbriimonadales bacterium]|nr:YHS domain-containing protein [Fimbriimonadales bacterium]
MRNFGLVVAVFAMSFTISSIAFVQTNKTSSQKPQQTKQTTAKKQEVRCPVTGKVITDIKKAPKLTYQGKTYYFSCQNCLAEFRKNPQKYIQQASNTRTVSNTAATKEGSACCSGETKAEGAACCAGDKATAQKTGGCCADKQSATQTAAATAPADKLICPVSGEELEEASAVRFTYNGKVYYTCCNGCKSKFLKDPETFAKKAEEVSKLQGKPEKADTK